MSKTAKFVDKFLISIVIILSIPAVWALLVPGFYGASDELHIAWLYEMYETLKLGQFPPRFVPDLSFGFGYPLFNFVFPLPFYIGSLFHFLGLTLVDSIKLVFLISVPLSGYFMYKLLRIFCGRFLSIVGMLIYVYTPYRATDIYVRGAIGEVFSFVFFPLIILAFLKIINSKKAINYRWVGIGALGLAGLILTHNISSYMFLPFALGYGFFKFWETGFVRKTVYPFFLCVVLGLMISSYFWIPALSESGLVKYSTTFDFWDHFPALRQLVTPYFGYGASVPGPYDGISFFIGYANIALILISLITFLLFYRNMKIADRGILIWAFIVIAFSIILMNHRSTPIWQNFPFLPYFQFPWRFLTLITFTSPLLVIALKYVPWKATGILLLFFTFLSFPNFRPHDFLGRTDNYYLSKYVPYPSVSGEYLTQSEEYLRLPVAVETRPTAIYPSLEVSSGYADQIIYKKDGRLGIEAEVIVVPGTIMRYNKYNFPGWVVKIDNKRVDAFSGSPFGQVSFQVPPGKHNVKISFEETDFRKTMNLISFLSLTAALGFCIKKSIP